MKDKTKLIITEVLAVTAVLAAVGIAIVVIRHGHQEAAAKASTSTDSSNSAQTTPARPDLSQPESNPEWVVTNAADAKLPAKPISAALLPGSSPSGQKPALEFGSRWDHPGQAPEFSRFSDWLHRFHTAPSTEARTALLAEGEALARERRFALQSIIRENPELALELAIPFTFRQGLPDSISALLEKPINDRGTLAVFAALPVPGQQAKVKPVWRRASLNGITYEAFVYGRRLGEPTRRDIPLNGIALGTLVALSENPVRLLAAAEAANLTAASPVEPICAVSGQSIETQPAPATALVAGRPTRLCGVAHAHDLNRRLIQAEASGGTGAGGNLGGGDTIQPSSYTEGIKRLLIIRVDFPDMPGEPLAASDGINLFTELNDFYRESSYNRAGIALSGSGSDVTPTLRLTNTAAYYGGNDDYVGLQEDARAAAARVGYNLADYDFDLTCFGPVPGWNWAGLGWVGAQGVWLRSYFTVGVAGHELGHNLGLNHANFWDTQGRSVIGNGSSVEYGDVYDTMGSGDAGPAHFNARNKSYLNWLPASGVQTVTNSGTFRIEAQDNPSASGLRALKIARNSQTNFWVEFRQQYTDNAWMMNGATLRWASEGNEQSDLLDTTPGSANGKNDAALVVGRTFSDLASGIHITTLRKAGTSPESLEIAVQLGTFPSNHPPTVTVGASTANPTLGATVTFTATASDSDGDALAYAWDFGDGTFGTNGAVVSKSWTLTSEFRVQCTVSDLKGGTTRDSFIVTVGSPPTYRISGRVTAGGVPLAGVRVYTGASRTTYTDSDGTYALVGLPASAYTLNASLDPYSFVAQGFANPIIVGPSTSQANFTASGFSNPPTITSQPRSATIAAGGNTNFSVVAAGTGPLAYQWRCQGTNLPGRTSTTLTLTNIQATQAGAYSVVITNATGAITSSPANLVVTAPVSGTLTLHVTGQGSVRGATNGQQLVVGRAYQLTALPAADQVFSNWTGSLPQSSPVLSFVMATNLQLTANFVPNPFAATRGSFNGLFYETNQVQPARAGFFSLTVSSKGAYSASLLTRGWKLKAKGLFDLTGRSTNQIVTPEGGTYAVSWTLANDGSDQILGTVNGGSWSAVLLGDRQVFHPLTNAATQAGRYTSLVPGDPNQPNMPGGDSFGLVAVDTRGTARLSGYLADQTRLAVRASLSRAGQWPVYASLYGGQGALLGWVSFRNEEATDLDGVLSWSRPAAPGTSHYSAGFVSESTLGGSRYTPPAAGQPLVDWTDPIIRFVGGDLTEAVTNRLTVTGTALVSTDPRTLKLKVAASSGLFTGTIRRSEAAIPQAFRGVFVQKSGLAGGFFLGTNTSGQVRLE